MKYVFICSPYRPVGEDPETELRKNIDQAKRACRLAVSRGLIPLAPHLYFTQFLDDNDPQERKFGQQAGKEYPAGCRVKLLEMDDIQAPPIGTEGTVVHVDDTGSICVRWDTGSGLNVIYGVDRCVKI